MKKAETIRLGQEILRDFEDKNVSIGVLVNKALRFAKLVGNDYYGTFLEGEAFGYSDMSNKNQRSSAIAVGRWDGTAEHVTVASAEVLEANNKSYLGQAEAAKAFQPSGNFAAIQNQQRMQEVAKFHGWITGNNKILSKLRGYIYQFVATNLAELMFSQRSASIFDAYQAKIDAKLAANAAAVLAKLPNVFERLDHGDVEAISHALASSRRIIDAFADSVFPARSEPFTMSGTSYEVTQEKVRNRLRAYIAQNISSQSRRERLGKNLTALYDRVSAGVHSDVTPAEAQALVLNTYLLLGELVELKSQ
jgi:hypothetical protein